MNLLAVLYICRTDAECNYGKCILGHCECNSQYYQQPDCSQCISLFMLADYNCTCVSPLLSQDKLCEQCIDSMFLDPFLLCTQCKGEKFDFDNYCNSCIGKFDFTTGCENCLPGYALYYEYCINADYLKMLLYIGVGLPIAFAFVFGVYLLYRKLLHKSGSI